MPDAPSADQPEVLLTPSATIPPEAPRPPRAGQLLPLEARWAPAAGGWSVTLPVRAEQFTAHKQVMVVEEVHIRPRRKQHVAHRAETVRRERLRVEREGNGAPVSEASTDVDDELP